MGWVIGGRKRVRRRWEREKRIKKQPRVSYVLHNDEKDKQDNDAKKQARKHAVLEGWTCNQAGNKLWKKEKDHN